MPIQRLYPPLFLYLIFLISPSVQAQSLVQEKMGQLNYLVGEWVGASTIYENGAITQEGSAYEKISYDLAGTILVIELNTEFLQLRTIITYDEENDKYRYHRFSKDGAAVYPAEFKDGQLIVWRDDYTRFFFTQTEEGNFQEYGEKWINGAWTRTFEDNFVNTE